MTNAPLSVKSFRKLYATSSQWKHNISAASKTACPPAAAQELQSGECRLALESYSQMCCLAWAAVRPSSARADTSRRAAPMLACPAPKKRKTCCLRGGTPGSLRAPYTAPTTAAAVDWMSSLKVHTPCAEAATRVKMHGVVLLISRSTAFRQRVNCYHMLVRFLKANLNCGTHLMWTVLLRPGPASTDTPQ